MVIERLLSEASESLSVRRCFGEPVEQAGTIVIPVAFVAAGGGGGEQGDVEKPDTPEHGGKASGRGGGFGGVTWPLGVYVIQEGRVRFVPALDATRVVLGVLALVRGVTRTVAVRRLRKAR